MAHLRSKFLSLDLDLRIYLTLLEDLNSTKIGHSFILDFLVFLELFITGFSDIFLKIAFIASKGLSLVVEDSTILCIS